MALNGINLPLAFTGQEALWQEVMLDMCERSSRCVKASVKHVSCLDAVRTAGVPRTGTEPVRD